MHCKKHCRQGVFAAIENGVMFGPCSFPTFPLKTFLLFWSCFFLGIFTPSSVSLGVDFFFFFLMLTLSTSAFLFFFYTLNMFLNFLWETVKLPNGHLILCVTLGSEVLTWQKIKLLLWTSPCSVLKNLKYRSKHSVETHL